jgi:hypothetical protein
VAVLHFQLNGQIKHDWQLYRSGCSLRVSNDTIQHGAALIVSVSLPEDNYLMLARLKCDDGVKAGESGRSQSPIH